MSEDSNAAPRLWALSATVTKVDLDGRRVLSAMLGVRIATSEDEARGSFLQHVFDKKPGFAVEFLLALEVKPETIAQAMEAQQSAIRAAIQGVEP
jgi:hypothetical protein